jgi:alkanesulfonate monooxygenase SsuD/methylene tetrahydromethanopterin reductase-like flavin-dependent oxidoreductase (luciferase family)
MDLCLMIEGQDGVTWPQWLALAQACEAHGLPQPAWITGTVDAVAEQLGALRDAGVARVMCQQLLHDDLDHVALIGELAPLLGP